MKSLLMLLFVALSVWPASLISEQPSENSTSSTAESSSVTGSGVILSSAASADRQTELDHLFQFAATSEAVGSLGGQFQISTNLNRRTNLRMNYNLFMWTKWESYEGFSTHAFLAMASTNASIDFYPFPNHGFRLSPGLLVHNPQVGEGMVFLASKQGGPFTVNGHKYYSAARGGCSTCVLIPTPPLTLDDYGAAKVDVAVKLPSTAFTISTGWGNMIPRKKTGPWTFPVELGVAFLGSPTVTTGWSGGQVCDAQGQNCTAVRLNTELQSDVRAEFASYKSHMPLLKTYPIISFGLAYCFGSRSGRGDRAVD